MLKQLQLFTEDSPDISAAGMPSEAVIASSYPYENSPAPASGLALAGDEAFNADPWGRCYIGVILSSRGIFEYEGHIQYCEQCSKAIYG